MCEDFGSLPCRGITVGFSCIQVPFLIASHLHKSVYCEVSKTPVLDKGAVAVERQGLSEAPSAVSALQLHRRRSTRGERREGRRRFGSEAASEGEGK